jgi:hypothetical protein
VPSRRPKYVSKDLNGMEYNRNWSMMMMMMMMMMDVNTKMKIDTPALLHATGVVGLKVLTEKTMYMAMSPRRNSGKNNIELFDFQYVTEFINLETRVTNQNCIPEEIKI